MYKVYFWPSANEYFFAKRPTKQEILKALKDEDLDEEDVKGLYLNLDITKVKVINNEKSV